MAKRKRAPNLTDAHIRTIVRLIDGWTGELTWEGLIDRAQLELHARYTRQSLAKHERIQQAFSRYVKHEPAQRQRRPEIELLTERIARQEAEVSRLEAENSRLLEQFARWAYNAALKNLDLHFLNNPLPPIDRKDAVS